MTIIRFVVFAVLVAVAVAVSPKATPCGCLSAPMCDCRPGFQPFHPDSKTWPDMKQTHPTGFVDQACGCPVCPCNGEVITAVQGQQPSCACLLQPVCACRAGETATATTAKPAAPAAAAARFAEAKDCPCQAQGPSCACYVVPEIKPCGQPTCPPPSAALVNPVPAKVECSVCATTPAACPATCAKTTTVTVVAAVPAAAPCHRFEEVSDCPCQAQGPTGCACFKAPCAPPAALVNPVPAKVECSVCQTTPAACPATCAKTTTTTPVATVVQAPSGACGCQSQGPSCPCYVTPEIKEPATTCGCLSQPVCACRK